jgi:hypothetical protein
MLKLPLKLQSNHFVWKSGDDDKKFPWPVLGSSLRPRIDFSIVLSDSSLGMSGKSNIAAEGSLRFQGVQKIAIKTFSTHPNTRSALVVLVRPERDRTRTKDVMAKEEGGGGGGQEVIDLLSPKQLLHTGGDVLQGCLSGLLFQGAQVSHPSRALRPGDLDRQRQKIGLSLDFEDRIV